MLRTGSSTRGPRLASNRLDRAHDAAGRDDLLLTTRAKQRQGRLREPDWAKDVHLEVIFEDFVHWSGALQIQG